VKLCLLRACLVLEMPCSCRGGWTQALLVVCSQELNPLPIILVSWNTQNQTPLGTLYAIARRWSVADKADMVNAVLEPGNSQAAGLPSSEIPAAAVPRWLCLQF